MPVRVAINGFGRTGRATFRAAREQGAEIEWAGINDVDGRHRRRATACARTRSTGASLDRSRRSMRRSASTAWRSRSSASRIPASLPWRDVDAEVVIESSGRFRAAGGRRAAPRRGRAQGDHLGPRQGARRDRRARRQLRRGVRPRPAPHHLQRVVHDELPGAGGQGAARGVRDPARRHDHRACVHGRPAPARRTAQGPAARPRRRRSTSCPRRPAPRRRSASSCRSWRAGCRASRCACRRRPSRSSTSRSRSSGRRPSARSTPPFASAPMSARSPGSWPTARTRSSPRPRRIAVLVDLRCGADHGRRRDAGQGRRLVRQRVGLLEPARRARAACARAGRARAVSEAIVVGVDGSERAKAALRFALADARRGRTRRRRVRRHRRCRAARLMIMVVTGASVACCGVLTIGVS